MKVIETLEVGPNHSSRAHACSTEPAFLMAGVGTLRLAPQRIGDASFAFLTHQVARAPRDLRAHVQRIYVNLAGADAGGSYGALLDLFIVLGPKGAPLRQRMLDSAKRLLDREQYHALVRRLDAGVHAADPMPAATASVLTKGARGSRCLVERVSAQDMPNLRDPLDEARSYLEYGQLDEARTLLEDALLDAPDRMELHQELLELYRATRDLDSFGAMWRLLDAAGNPSADAWRETAEELSLAALAGH